MFLLQGRIALPEIRDNFNSRELEIQCPIGLSEKKDLKFSQVPVDGTDSSSKHPGRTR